MLQASDLVARWGGDDGQIDKDEFFKEITYIGISAARAEIDALFEQLDEDASGIITRDEMRAAFRKVCASCVCRDCCRACEASSLMPDSHVWWHARSLACLHCVSRAPAVALLNALHSDPVRLDVPMTVLCPNSM